ncbi:MAG: ParB/RepB/Spo0J family partition protein [Eubacteriales bacterium]|nr:ParB/RepB/Spo0J family partition protein [Christensenellaceae bacterium]MDY3241145.1 ParB/RepB/Spo0J family partition protein [Eubacteriales bacterium]MDD6360525.1 ParB/RepB/Spo0J family partition protein [Christensenellaceae bacterium]MDD7092317.1 ParB/RepB/Spo0J family partition protein [Christensenellaceae bacterium]MDY4709468.1 ParB/RepB/Spo0J family partition protein [Eubacteriales bacterium]
MSNKGLGKGLAALLGNLQEEEAAAEMTESAKTREVMDVDISLIDTNPYQPRKVFDKSALEELAASIKTFGIIQPLIVLRSGNRYVIIAGERRFRAARIAGLTSVPCVVRELTPREMREIALIENLQREDLNPVEAAEGIAELIKSFNLTQDEAAERIGMGRPTVTNLLRLLTLNKEVLELVREGRLSGSHARCLVVVTDPEVQLYYANKAADNKMSVRELEQQIQLYLGRKLIPSGARKEKQSKELKGFVNDMKRIFGTKVKILGNDEKGRICIDYFSNDDLQRIYDLIDSLRH